ncbi:glycoside hydrolase family 75 protein [Streptomyces sp. 378]|uniref:glycoside hydrolase family 75 protein n=1 Tax=Streptomyces sp. 378 TaxID=3049412 RepID=UPI0024C2827D|nr:glycoside hydrolase family 75 protein [Streptomyces sp. 378]MDK1342881.1 glycoside hydrolase family 75 protein [Streptomyces sp. 378]
MRVQSLTLAAASAALLAPTTPPAAPTTPPAAPTTPPAAPTTPLAVPTTPLAVPTTPLAVPTTPAVLRESAVSAAGLLAKVRDCTPVSRGRYRSDNGAPATIPVCGTRDAVFWKADMDIDCDGRPGPRCNHRTDPYFAASTAYAQSDGRPLSAEHLPYVVVPAPSGIWDYRDHGIGGGSVVAVVYRDRVRYAVVGDTGPQGIIGEASYATAEALGIRPDPHGGGVPSGVTYIVFKNTKVSPIEDHAAAVTAGERAAKRFIDGSGPGGR